MISLAFCLLGVPLIAARTGHGAHAPSVNLTQHDHDAHSRQPDHGIPHDPALDTARCALACASLPAPLPVPTEPELMRTERLLPPSVRWLDLAASPRLERPPRIDFC